MRHSTAIDCTNEIQRNTQNDNKHEHRQRFKSIVNAQPPKIQNDIMWIQLAASQFEIFKHQQNADLKTELKWQKHLNN